MGKLLENGAYIFNDGYYMVKTLKDGSEEIENLYNYEFDNDERAESRFDCIVYKHTIQ